MLKAAMTVLADREALDNGAAVGGVEDFRRDEEFRRFNPPLSADLPAEECYHAVEHLIETEDLPDGGGRRRSKAKVLLSRKPKDFAASVVCLLGLRWAKAIQEALAVTIREKEGLPKAE